MEGGLCDNKPFPERSRALIFAGSERRLPLFSPKVGQPGERSARSLSDATWMHEGPPLPPPLAPPLPGLPVRCVASGAARSTADRRPVRMDHRWRRRVGQARGGLACPPSVLLESACAALAYHRRECWAGTPVKAPAGLGMSRVPGAERSAAGQRLSHAPTAQHLHST